MGLRDSGTLSGPCPGGAHDMAGVGEATGRRQLPPVTGRNLIGVHGLGGGAGAGRFWTAVEAPGAWRISDAKKFSMRHTTSLSVAGLWHMTQVLPPGSKIWMNSSVAIWSVTSVAAW